MGSESQPRPIHDALRESLAGIDLTFGPTQPSFVRDRAQTASGRERPVADFLESYFPSDWSVKKGPIYDRQGNTSAEVDCAVCVPQHPPCRTPIRDVILAEGVYSAIEVKPDISSCGDEGEFARALKQAHSVKRLKRTIVFSGGRKRDWPEEAHRIPYVIFAKKMPDLEETAAFMTEQRKKNEWSPWDLPDMVLGYQYGLIYHAPEASVCSIAPLFAKNQRASGEGFLVFPTGADTLILFLALLYSFAAPQPQLSEPILKDYLLPLNIPPGMVLLGVNP